MEKILAYLEQLDLSEIEAKLYLTLLETGPISVRDIANRIKIKRTTTYLYIDQLMQKGLITKVTTGSKTQITATQPETSLEHLVHEKVDKAKLIQGEFPSVLQNIEEAFPKTGDNGEAEIKYYKGKLGVRKIYEDALKSDELRSYFNNEIIKDALEDNTPYFLEAMKINKTIKLYEIVQDSPASREQLITFQEKNPHRDRYFYKFFPKGIMMSASDILIYDNKVAIVNVRNQISGIILHNNDYFKSSKELFDLIWNGLPENK